MDYSENHDSSAIKIDGPEWKTDENGGYFEIKPGDTLHVPNLIETQGWTDASFSLWLYFEDGGIGFNMGSTCKFYFLNTTSYWGSHYTNALLPIKKWFHLVITFDHQKSWIYADGIRIGHAHPSGVYRCTHLSDPPPDLFPLSGVHHSSSVTDFQGKIRAVQFYTRTLTEDEIELLSLIFLREYLEMEN
ncbi:hypothetical protein GEMRC1_008357 [Eukaryota sp. GEM-RC1]